MGQAASSSPASPLGHTGQGCASSSRLRLPDAPCSPRAGQEQPNGRGGGARWGETLGKALQPHGALGLAGRGGRTEAWGSWQSSEAVGLAGRPLGEMTMAACASRGHPAPSPHRRFHARPTPALRVLVLERVRSPGGGGGGKRSGHIGAKAPSHPSYLLMILGGEAASSRQEPSRRTAAIGPDLALPCRVLHFPRCSPDVRTGLSSRQHHANPAEQLQGWPQPCSRCPSGLTAGWVTVCPFGRALPEGAFHLAAPASCPRRAGPQGAGVPVPPAPCARLSLPPMGSINNPFACGLFPA